MANLTPEQFERKPSLRIEELAMEISMKEVIDASGIPAWCGDVEEARWRYNDCRTRLNALALIKYLDEQWQLKEDMMKVVGYSESELETKSSSGTQSK